MKLKTTASLLVLAGLMGCSTLEPDMRVEPVLRFGPAPVLRPQMSVSESMYAMARLAHDQGQLATAAQRYRRALDMKPDHVGALNGLGVILAQDGRTREALDLLVRARDLAPGAAHIHNNLGYTLLRAQRLDEAQVALRMARELQPDSPQTLLNLAILERARADEARQRRQTAAVLPPQQASAGGGATAGPVQIVSVAPQVFELRVAGAQAGLPPANVVAVAEPVAAAGAVSQSLVPVAAPVPVRQSEPVLVAPTAHIVPSPEPSVMVLQVVVDSLVLPAPVSQASASPASVAHSMRDVVQVEPMTAPDAGYRLALSREQALQSGPFALWTDIRGVKLEIANGVGVVRLARRTADRLAEDGVATARLTNAKPYRQLRTQIEYAPGQEAAVQALASRLPVQVDLVPVSRLDRDMGLRLVLGQPCESGGEANDIRTRWLRHFACERAWDGGHCQHGVNQKHQTAASNSTWAWKARWLFPPKRTRSQCLCADG
jgi:hypothetical protein